MNVDLVINQIKAVSSFFAGNVAGAAAYAKAVENETWLPYPAAYVIPLDMSAEGNSSAVGEYQIVTDRIAVIVAFDNSTDRRGQAAVSQIDLGLAALFRAILNWRPDSTIDNPGTWQTSNPFADHESRGFYFDGAQLLDHDRARLFYRYDFAIDRTISEADGWQYTGVPLTEIDVTFAVNGTISAVDPVAAILLPQT